MPQLTVQYLDTADPAALYHRYPGQSAPQPVHVELDLRLGALRADWDANIGGGGVPESVWHGRTLRLPIPLLTAAGANALLGDLAPAAQAVLNESEIVWDGENNVGRLTEAGESALETMTAMIAGWEEDPTDRVEVWDAADWFSAGDEPPVTADSTDSELQALAEGEPGTFEPVHLGGHVVIDGAYEWLVARREELRDEARERLEIVADTYAGLRAERDGLIRRQITWGDTQRAVGERAGLSHVQVGKIADEEVHAHQQV